MSLEVVSDEWVVSETTALDALVIEPGGTLKAPPGKQLTMTVNGVGTEPAPGGYKGEVMITVSDCFNYHTVRFGQHEDICFRAGVCIIDGKYSPEHSAPAIVKGGTVTDSEASGFSITGDEWDFTGILVTGESAYTISDAKIKLTGDGTNDFVGLGAAVAVNGKAQLTVNNTLMRTYGITRGALCSNDDTVVTLNDCYLETRTYIPTPKQLEDGAKLGRMMEPPWMMGLRGNGRTTNLVGMSKSYYNRCHVISDSWGVLSIDGSVVNRMYVKDSLIEIKGASGYGTISIADDTSFDYSKLEDGPACLVSFDHSVVSVPTVGIIMCVGLADAEVINGSEINSGIHGVHIFRNCGKLSVNSKSALYTGKASFLVQGANCAIEVDDAVLEPENGVILCLIDNDDPGHNGGPEYKIPLGETDTPVPGRDLTVADPKEDVFMTISNMETAGDIYNATTNLKANTRVFMPAPGLPPMPTSEHIRGVVGDELQGAKNLDLKLENAGLSGVISSAVNSYREGVESITKENLEEFFETAQTVAPPVNNGVILSLDKDSVWTVTGTSYLTGLTLAPGAQIKAPGGGTLTLTANGQPITAPGTYSGLIVAEVEVNAD